MRVFVVEDDRKVAGFIQTGLEQEGHAVDVLHEGNGAGEQALTIDYDAVVLDVMLPGRSGFQVLRDIRARKASLPVLILTAKDSIEERVAGLDAGADDYVVKPFDADELRARVHVGIRVLKLQERLAERVAELQTALLKVKQLSGLLPICSYCKRIRSDQNYWEQVDRYVAQHSDAEFSHGICPDCFKTVIAKFDFEH
jgi:phosphoserine phosphatase RsbU/P